MLPLDPLDQDTAWGCGQCGLEVEAGQQQEVLGAALQIINSYPKEGITAPQVEEMLHQLAPLLSPSHWLVAEIKQKLLSIYTNMVSIYSIQYLLHRNIAATNFYVIKNVLLNSVKYSVLHR